MDTTTYIGVRVNGTDAELRELGETIAHIEAFPSDPDRIRVRFKDGSAGQWYSRLWSSVKASWLLKRA